MNCRIIWFWLKFRDPGWLWSKAPVAAGSLDSVEALGGLGAVPVVVTVGAG